MTFWGQKLADYVLKDCDCLINLASKEYSKSILKYIPENVRVITCVFGELIDGKIKEKGTYAKWQEVPLYAIWQNIR